MRDEEKREGKRKGKLEEKGKVKRRVGLGWVGLELATTKNDFYKNGLCVYCVVYIHIFYCLMVKHYSKHQLGTGKVGR